ncbi:MAG: DNA repair protein RecO [Thermodesulfobacteriota bacterium]
MTTLSTPAIVLHRAAYGDFDLILTLYTLESGKLTAIAKSAKKSIRRFAGALEPFSLLNVVLREGKGMPVLQEAGLTEPFGKIREAILKTAYAAYWAEIVKNWSEEGHEQASVFNLLVTVLRALDGRISGEEVLSIFFQVHFLKLAGLLPNIHICRVCHLDLEKIKTDTVIFHIAKGGIICDRCHRAESRIDSISKGSLKQLKWIEKSDLPKALRVRFSPLNLKESRDLLEGFISHHLGRRFQSLRVLRQIRCEEKDAPKKDSEDT